MKKRVLILGGDGFCGWPTSLYLSQQGYEVTIVDNMSRRMIDIELGCDSLTPISSIFKRIDRWKELTGKDIDFYNFDISRNYHRLLTLLKEFEPDTVVHFAEQRAAPYSMKSSYHKRYTVDNNLNGTNNLLAAIVESKLDTHVVHLGTMGVYGYQTAGLKIPEGYLKVKVETREGEKELDIMYPPSPGSIYHMTKTQDALLFYFYNKNDGLRVTDLHQGVVWGTETDETRMDETLINRFDYDGDYGTVLNRFLVQAAVGHPLTVHGTGGQTRAFIHIKDTVQCIKMAIENPPDFGSSVEIFNQATETHSVGYLAELVSQNTGAEIRYYNNPRKEATANELKVKNDKFLNLGLSPVKLKNGLMDEVMYIVDKYKYRCDMSKIPCTSCWCEDMEVDREGRSATENRTVN
ncbi:NAD-dependent epimerase/dehydratase [Desulfonatronospira thiodismutans ASO3-1]|uniref:NAD-dependent epimerase/dehydratase n=1 Tax=Desulfonatronospira thiodismutans ASO3-1 TaxID=555779 RepID=D6SN93_9BACT|nr:NAD-dependent epimerase/dehydratase family protein [Desulfonatronospira thiodismutans]EFI34219.1 NAD-dependent epimerase/dehydratase [Desulfonatronospira thiodismutans ASO3-1]